MTLRDYIRMARRESRRAGARILLFIMCIAVGVACVVVVAGVSRGVAEGIRLEGRRLMAADVDVEGRRPIPANLDEIARRFGVVARADVREFVSVAVVPGSEASQLVQVKVVEGDYPFYGKLRMDPDQPLDTLATSESIVVAPEILVRLQLRVGEALSLGGVAFQIAGTILEEPDKVGVSFTLGPRVFLSPEGLARTSLADFGARVDYRALLKLQDSATAADAQLLASAIESELSDSAYYETRTFISAQASLRRSFERIGRYLGLVGLLSLLVGGVGVAQVVRAWIAARTDDVAVLRCLGTTPREAVNLFTMQVAAMGLLASVLGAGIGVAVLYTLPFLVDETVLPVDLLRAWQPLAALRGIVMGLGVAMVFTVPPLLALRKVSPSRVFRRETDPVEASRLENLIAALALLLSIWGAAWVQTESWQQGLYFVGGVVGTALLLVLVAKGILWIVRYLPKDAGGLHIRHGLARLGRPGAGTMAAIVALGLGVTFVFAIWTVQDHLGEQLLAETPADAPNAFFLDVQTDQWPALAEQLKREGATGIDSQPIVTARFTAIDGEPVSELAKSTVEPGSTRPAQDQGGPSRWRLTREQRITYGTSLPRGNRVIRGAFPSGTSGGVSVEESFASRLGVDIGSKLTLDVQGVPVDLVVTSLRTVDWRTFGINFFLFAETGGPLDEAPQQRVAVARLPDASTSALQGRVVSAFPNITVIPIKDIMEKVVAVLDKLGIAVRALGFFIVIAGTIVLGGAIAASQVQRAREVALMKTIGMTRGDVLAIFSIEYALIGTVAGLVGVVAGMGIAWYIAVQSMDLPWTVNIGHMIFALAATAVIAVLAGISASIRALSVRPVEVLRASS